MVSVDIYLNETTTPRRRDPAAAVAAAARPLRPGAAAVRGAQRGQLQRAGAAARRRPARRVGDPRQAGPDRRRPRARRRAGAWPTSMGVARRWCSSAVNDPSSPIHGRDADEILAALGDEPGPARMLDFMLQTGPFGAAFGANPDGASLALLRANPHGVDFGALAAAAARGAAHAVGHDRAGPPGADRRPRTGLHAAIDRRRSEQPLVLVGRRHLRSNNSWMHNIEVLVKGKPRCTLQVHPDDADALGPGRRGSGAGDQPGGHASTPPVEVTDAIRPGVVSLPHGWGHGQPGTRHAGGRRASRGEQQRPGRPRGDRPAERHVGAERHPGRDRAPPGAGCTARRSIARLLRACGYVDNHCLCHWLPCSHSRSTRDPPGNSHGCTPSSPQGRHP